MFWDCPKRQNYWLDVQNWICTNFTHCKNVIFTRDLIILGSEKNTITDRHLDQLMGKYHIFTAKLQGNVPHVNTLIMMVKHRFLVEKYCYTVYFRYECLGHRLTCSLFLGGCLFFSRLFYSK